MTTHPKPQHPQQHVTHRSGPPHTGGGSGTGTGTGSTMPYGCVEVGDIFRTIPHTASQAEINQLTYLNEQNRRIYVAINWILTNDFGFAPMPDKSSDFCSAKVNPADRARFASIQGLMIADNWTDPSLGKSDPQDGDTVIPDPNPPPPDPNASILVASRFKNALVMAVQEYSQRYALFQMVYNHLVDEARRQQPPINASTTAPDTSTTTPAPATPAGTQL
jgi:hypothetical protein